MSHTQFAVILFIFYPITIFIQCRSHYVYNKYPSVFTALFFPTKETIWEHSKLFFMPCLLMFFIINLIIGNAYPNFRAVAGFVSVAMSILPCVLYPLMQRFCNLTEQNEIYYSIGLTAVILLMGFNAAFFFTISSINFVNLEMVALIVVLLMLSAHAVTTYFPISFNQAEIEKSDEKAV